MEPRSESKYERLRKIGIGSYGVVFKCVNRQTGQIVAIKRYSENDSDPMIRKIAMREVRMLRHLKHPNLIHLIEVFRRKRRLHLVFDYCELTVLDVIERYANNCPLNLIKKIIWQLVNGCIHRDIKPENILINQSGVVKLCDFGFARNLSSSNRMVVQSQSTIGARQLQLEREAQLLGVPSSQLMNWSNGGGARGEKENCPHNTVLASGVQASSPNGRLALTEYVATRWYRAPELLVGEVYYDTKIDIWAIGCVTAELMRGEPLWPGKTDLDQLSMIMNSLGSLTPCQAHTLVTQNLYDQINTERLLNQSTIDTIEPVERRLPARVGQLGIDFVSACLQMDPARRPTSEQLLQHSYIYSARMTQFVKGASGRSEQVPLAGHSPHQQQAEHKSVALSTVRSPNSSNSSGSSPRNKDSIGAAAAAAAEGDLRPGRLNSQTTKRLVLARDPNSSIISSVGRKEQGSFVPIPISRPRIVGTPADKASGHQTAAGQRQHKRKLPAVSLAGASLAGPTSGSPLVRIDRDLHMNHRDGSGTHQNQPTSLGMGKSWQSSMKAQLANINHEEARAHDGGRLSQSNGNIYAGSGAAQSTGSPLDHAANSNKSSSVLSTINFSTYNGNDAELGHGAQAGFKLLAKGRRQAKHHKEPSATSQTIRSSSTSFLPKMSRI